MPAQKISKNGKGLNGKVAVPKWVMALFVVIVALMGVVIVRLSYAGTFENGLNSQGGNVISCGFNWECREAWQRFFFFKSLNR